MARYAISRRERGQADATALLALLYEEGKIDLDAHIQRYVPSFPEKKHPITTRQLAGHIAGIRHYNGDAFS